ncbi:MAG: class I SAM-dependent methyltransferase [Christensenella sp.]|nr:class I SAM-dependent methyltransferase [Christensenella sp.]
MNHEQYDALADVYDSLMYDVDYGKWAEYLCSLLETSGVVPNGTVLEYACGTGNITLPLFRSGFDVTALDISEEMLEIAQQKVRRHAGDVRFVCADMSEFRLNKPVQAAICACDGVNYITEEEKLDLFFKSVFSNLVPGGVFLFDISSAYKIKNILGNEFFYDDSDEVTYFWQNVYDAQKEAVRMEITLFMAEGDGYKRFDETHVQKAWTEEVIIKALGNAGFGEAKAFTFMTQDAPRTEEERIQFLAVR